MAQDLRELFKKEGNKEPLMKKGHEERFLQRLDKELPTRGKSTFYFIKIAASVLVLFSLGIYTYTNYESATPQQSVVVDKGVKQTVEQGYSLGDLSPDLKKVENYYVASINLELSRLEVSVENKALVDDYMSRLSELDEEYKRLNIELNEIGPNDQTITALIKNLQLRLQLLQKLKLKLNQLKSSENEQVTSNSV
jgi:archaellum component FlaC